MSVIGKQRAVSWPWYVRDTFSHQEGMPNQHLGLQPHHRGYRLEVRFGEPWNTQYTTPLLLRMLQRKQCPLRDCGGGIRSEQNGWLRHPGGLEKMGWQEQGVTSWAKCWVESGELHTALWLPGSCKVEVTVDLQSLVSGRRDADRSPWEELEEGMDGSKQSQWVEYVQFFWGILLWMGAKKWDKNIWESRLRGMFFLPQIDFKTRC